MNYGTYYSIAVLQRSLLITSIPISLIVSTVVINEQHIHYLSEDPRAMNRYGSVVVTDLRLHGDWPFLFSGSCCQLWLMQLCKMFVWGCVKHVDFYIWVRSFRLVGLTVLRVIIGINTTLKRVQYTFKDVLAVHKCTLPCYQTGTGMNIWSCLIMSPNRDLFSPWLFSLTSCSSPERLAKIFPAIWESWSRNPRNGISFLLGKHEL